jgi:hypothetical protein
MFCVIRKKTSFRSHGTWMYNKILQYLVSPAPLLPSAPQGRLGRHHCARAANPPGGWICSPWGVVPSFSGCRAPRRLPEGRSAVLLAGSTYPPAGSALPPPVCTCLVVPPCGVAVPGAAAWGRRLAPPPALIIRFVFRPTVPGLTGGRPWVMVEGLQAKVVGPLVAG